MMEYLIVYASSVYSSTGVVELFLVTAFLFWYFNPSLRGMMEVITANFYQKYSGGEWTSGSGVGHEAGLVKQRLTQNQTKRKERLKDNKDFEAKTEDNLLFSCKTEAWDVIDKKLPRPLVGLSCQNCTPLNARQDVGDNAGRVVNIFDVNSLPNPDGTYNSRSNQSWFSWLFRDLLHCIKFRSYHFPYIYDTVLEDEALKEVIADVAHDFAVDLHCKDEQTFIKIFSKQKARAVKLLTVLRSTLSDLVLRVSAWVFLKTLPKMFSSMSVPPGQIAMLKRANASGLPLIFLPLHRSHMDYIAVTLTLVLNDIKAPLVAAGENLNIPVFGWILRGLGAFFIKRRMDPVTGKKDKLYRSLLHTYMNQCIQAGHNFEFFIEGRRSRTGKPSMPKGGLLSIFIDAYINGTLTDALLVPVSINCEKLVDDSFLSELSGAPKSPESFTSTVSAIKSAFTTTYGHIRIDFNQPFSLNELVGSFQSRLRSGNGIGNSTLHVAPSTASLYGTDVVVEEERHLVDSIARHLLYDCIRSTAVMSTNAVSFLLLYVYRDGGTLGELASALDILRSELRAAGRDTGFTGDSLDVVNHAVSLLGPGLVKKEKRADGELLKPVTLLPNVLELSYYSNILLPHFILEATVSLSLLSLSQEEGRLEIKHDELIETCLSLCQILQFEFLFTKTCQNLNDALQETIDNMITSEIISVKYRPVDRSRMMARDMDLGIHDDYDNTDVLPSTTYHTNTCHSKLLMYSGLIRSLIDTYSVTAHCLKTLSNSPSTEKQFIQYSLSQVRKRVDNQTFKYGESVSTETITNSVRLFEKLNIIEGYHQDGVKLLSISIDLPDDPSVDSTVDKVQPIIDRIHRFQISNVLT